MTARQLTLVERGERRKIGRRKRYDDTLHVLIYALLQVLEDLGKMETQVEEAVKDEGFQESNEAPKDDQQENDVPVDLERKKVEEVESRAMRIDAGLSRNVSVGEKVLLGDEFSADLYLSYRSKILQAWNHLKTCKSDQNGTNMTGS